MNRILEVNNLSIVFGGLRAVSDFSCELHEGELTGLIGPNGAGKTTVFNMLSGLYTPTSGEITFQDREGKHHAVGKVNPSTLNRLGISRTFQNIRLFGNLTVEDNVRIALHATRKENPVDVLLRLPRFYHDEQRMVSQTSELLSLFKIEHKRHDLARNLPYGEQRKLEIVRALASNPSLLLLDEPAAGMNPQETQELMKLISFIRKEFRLTILLIEHDMHLVMGICERLMVLDYGRVIAEGLPADIRKNAAVIKAYLGDVVSDTFAEPAHKTPMVSDTFSEPAPKAPSLLSVSALTVHYGAIQALRGISFEVAQGEIITLIGSNGAGKTTTLHAISNIIRKSGGQVSFDGKDITSLSPDKIVSAGLIQVPEGRRIFANLTVKDNLEIGAYTRKDKAAIRDDLAKVYEVFPRLKERRTQVSGTLSGGEQQMLAMGRALMSAPRLLLLDEPSMGLAPILVDEIFSIIQRVNQTGMTILLVEQNAFKALDIAVRAYILETGEVIKSGSAQNLLRDDAVKSAYLGGE